MSKRKILLADDSVTIQTVVNLTFAHEGIEVVTVGDGDAAMRKFSEVAPDLVLADVNMPGLDGYEICKTIKQNEQTKRIPVILLVGSFEPFDEEKARQVGADEFLTKPFQSIRLLVDKVSELLEAKIDEDEFLRPIENPDAPISSFADTLEMNPSDEFDTADETIKNLGDSGMDDEMIQTSQVGSSPIDEIDEFESAPIYESFADDLSRTSLKPPYNAEVAADYSSDQDWGKTQPLSKADLEELTDVSTKEKNAPSLDLDAMDLLEFPISAKAEIPAERVQPTESDIFDEVLNAGQNAQTESPKPPDETLKELSQAEVNISPELVEAIASRVVEKFSNKVVKQIVREVLAQMERKK